MNSYNDLMPSSDHFRTKKAYFAAIEQWKNINSGLTQEAYDEMMEWLSDNVVYEQFSFRYINTLPTSTAFVDALDIALAMRIMDLIPYGPFVEAGTIDKTSGRYFFLGLVIAAKFPQYFTKRNENDDDKFIISPATIAMVWNDTEQSKEQHND
jgi:hypothetical protein